MSGSAVDLLRDMRRIFGLFAPDGPGKARTFPDPTTPRPPPAPLPVLHRRPSHQAGYSWRKWEPTAEPGDPLVSVAQPLPIIPVPAERLRRYVG